MVDDDDDDDDDDNWEVDDLTVPVVDFNAFRIMLPCTLLIDLTFWKKYIERKNKWQVAGYGCY